VEDLKKPNMFSGAISEQVIASWGRIHDTSVSSELTNRPNKLACLSLASLYSLLYSNILAYWAVCVFTTLHFLQNLWTGPFILRVCPWQAFTAYCIVTLQLNGLCTYSHHFSFFKTYEQAH